MGRVINTEVNSKDRSGDFLFMVEAHHVSNHFDETDNTTDNLRVATGAHWDSFITGRYTMAKQQHRLNYQNIRLDFKGYRVQEDGSIREEVVVVKNDNINIIAPMKTSRDSLESKYKKFKEVDINSNPVFQDHACRINIYENNSNKGEESRGILNLYMTVKPEYNFYDAGVEETVVERASMHETHLPNFYHTIFSPSQVYEEGAMISTNDFLDVQGYLDEWSETTASTPDLPDTSSQMRTYFTKSQSEEMSSHSKKSIMFPMSARINFNTEFESGLGTVLADTNYYRKMRDYVSNSSYSTPVRTVEVVTRISENGAPSLSYPAEPVHETPTTQVRRFYDVEEYFEKHLDDDFSLDSFMFTEEDNSNHRAYNAIMTIIARSKIEKIKNEKFRSYGEIVQGKLAHTETVLYTLRKYDQIGNLLQSFYFTNSDELKNIDFVDTQVKYGKKYKYDLSAIKLIVGTKYEYENIGADRYSVVSRPSLKLAEVSLIQEDVLILDSAPLPPEFYPIPIRGVDNKIKLFLNSSIGSGMMEPITFTSEEAEKIREQRIAQKIESGPIMYKNDDYVREFEIFKLDYPPTSYQDFYSNGELIYTKSSDDYGDLSTSSVYIDSVKPNHRFYYCARSIDVHYHTSNPTIIWEVEMVSEGGAIYPRYSEYRIGQGTTPVTSKVAKRFIQISPTTLQRMVNDEASNILEHLGPEFNQNILLGLAEERLWGKKFKLRLTSKSTGKKVDFNFRFNVKKKLTNVEDNEE